MFDKYLSKLFAKPLNRLKSNKDVCLPRRSMLLRCSVSLINILWMFLTSRMLEFSDKYCVTTTDVWYIAILCKAWTCSTAVNKEVFFNRIRILLHLYFRMENGLYVSFCTFWGLYLQKFERLCSNDPPLACARLEDVRSSRILVAK